MTRFPADGVGRMKASEDVTALAREPGISRAQLYRFKRKLSASSRRRGRRRGSKRRPTSDSADVSRNWNVLWRDKRWNWIFSEAPCCAPRKIAGSRGSVPASRLPPNPAR
jgi:hypothetical protein